MKKRILSIVLALGIGLTQLPMTSFAADAVHVETVTQAGTDGVSEATVETQAAADTGAKQGVKAQENTESTAVEKQPENEKKQNGENTEDSEKKSVAEQTSKAEEASEKDVAEAKSETEVQPSSEVKKDAEKKADSDAKQEAKESSEKNADAEKQTESAAKEAKKTASETTPKPEQKAEAAFAVTADEVQKQIDALPGAENITEETKAVVMAQLDAIDALKGELSDEEGQKLDFTRYDAAVAAVMALNGEGNESATLVSEEEYALAINGHGFNRNTLTIQGDSGTAVYDPSSKTLTLNNFSVNVDWDSGAAIDSRIAGLKIIVNGTNKITLPASLKKMTAAIYADEDTIIRGKSGSGSDQLIVTSASNGNTEKWSDDTTRVALTYEKGTLTIENLTLTMEDTSASSYRGHSTAVYSNSTGKLTMKNCKLNTKNTQHGVYMNQGAAEISDTTFNIQNGSISKSSGVNFVPGTQNKLTNCGGTISAQYPVYTYGKLAVSGNQKLTLNGSDSDYAIVVKQYNSSSAAAEVTFNNVNIDINARSGIDLEGKSTVTLESGTVAVTVEKYGVRLDSNATFTAKNGTLNIKSTGDASAAVLAGGTVKLEGGNHTLTAKTAGYAASGTNSVLQISGGTVAVNAPVGVQTDSSASGSVTISGGTTTLNCTTAGIYKEKGSTAITGGTVNINCTARGIQTLKSAGKTSITGGKVTITDTNETSTVTGINAGGEMEIGGTAEVTFKNCKYDIQSSNSANKITGGTVKLSGTTIGLFLIGNFAVTGGNITSTGDGYGIYGAEGTITLKGGTVDLSSSDYPMIAYQNCIFDFAGAKVTLNTTKNCALVIYDDGSSYKVTGGEVILKSTQAGANKMFTSLADSYGVWAGASESVAKLASNPTTATLNNKYVRIAKNQTYTLTLVDVKEGTSASVYAGADITYTAKDPQSGKHFSHWELTVGSNTTNVGTNTTYTGKMPAADATLKAVYETCSSNVWVSDAQHHWKVCGVCKKNFDTAAHSFGEWTTTKPATTTEKGEKTRTCSICNYAETMEIPVESQPHAITVIGGTASADGATVTEAQKDIVITLKANAPETGKVFDAWVVTKGADKVTLADATKETTTFTMPDEEVEIQATYKNVLYTITMTDGEATVAGQTATTASYQAEVTIKAATAPAGKTFERWDIVSGQVALADAKAETTTFTMPAGNVALKAVYKNIMKEQFNLEMGKTYYFDLSSKTIPGRINKNLGDKTLHFVPFTYVGTVDAYVLNSASNGVASASQQASETTDSSGKYGYTYLHSLFVGDKITGAVTWNQLNAEGLIFGNTLTTGNVEYALRAPSVGSKGDVNTGANIKPVNNEWSAVLKKEMGGFYDDLIGQDTSEKTPSSRMRRNSGWVARISADSQKSTLYFRPVLEVLNASSLGANGLQAVTLDLNGGKLEGNAKIQIVVKNGASFTAPTMNGISVPNGCKADGSKWKDENGKFYAVGTTVPATVKTLTLQWNDTESPVIQGLENGKTYCLSAQFTVSDNVGVDKVTVNGTEIKPDADGKYTLTGKNGTQKVVASDSWGIVLEMTVTVKATHTWGAWASNGNGTHTHSCTVEDCNASETKDCTGGTATCTDKATCEICGELYGKINPDNHTGKLAWTQTEKTHEQKYTCCDKVTVAEENHEWEKGICTECGYVCAHSGGTATCTDKATCEICGELYGEVIPDNHTGDLKWTQTEKTHEQKYTCCDKVTVAEENHEWEKGICTECGYVCAHSGGTATCTEKATCKICGELYGEINPDKHTGDLKWIQTEKTHEQKYTCCGKVTIAEENHTWKAGVCTVCGYVCAHQGGTATCTDKAICEICGEAYGEVNPKHHSGLKKIEKEEATVAKTGHTEYWQCGACQKLFSDASAVTEIKEADTILPKSQPEIIDGKKATWKDTDKKGLEIRSDAPVEDFVDVLVDGKVLSEKEYTVTDKEGTLITLKPSYLKKLGTGKYKIVVRSESGDAETTFRVEKAALKAEKVDDTKKKTNTPATGDESDFMLWLLLILVSGGAVAATVAVKKKRR